jgi:hypothetical protein
MYRPMFKRSCFSRRLPSDAPITTRGVHELIPTAKASSSKESQTIDSLSPSTSSRSSRCTAQQPDPLQTCAIHLLQLLTSVLPPSQSPSTPALQSGPPNCSWVTSGGLERRYKPGYSCPFASQTPNRQPAHRHSVSGPLLDFIWPRTGS